MNLLDIVAYARQKLGTEPDYPWESHPECAVLRHASSRKWYALVMTVAAERLGLSSSQQVAVLNVKVRPEHTGSLLLHRGILPAYHMNKEHWVSVLLEGEVDDDMVISLLEESYSLTST